MNKELKAKWVAALRNGNYQQDTQALRTNNGFCCLGVLLDLSGKGSWNGSAYEYEDENEKRVADGDLCSLRRDFGINGQEESTLLYMNDGSTREDIRRHSFAEIADWIEVNL